MCFYVYIKSLVINDIISACCLPAFFFILWYMRECVREEQRIYRRKKQSCKVNATIFMAAVFSCIVPLVKMTFKNYHEFMVAFVKFFFTLI